MKTIYDLVNRKSMFITTTFAIHADGAFLNGSGIDKRSENRNVSTVKSYWKNKKNIPYVSAQAWRRWLRNTLVEENNWNQSLIEPVLLSEKESTSKIAGQLDPINYPEDDIFGYMYTVAKEKKDEKFARRLPEVQLVRSSTIKTSILRGVTGLTSVSTDEGFIHLKQGTPLPYSTEFYSSEMIASISFEVYRLGMFVNFGDKNNNEIDPFLVDSSNELTEIDHPVINKAKIYTRKDLTSYQNTLAGKVIKGISLLRGGSKMAQFGADVSPKLLIIAGMSVSGMIFNDLLVPDNDKPSLNIAAFKEIISDFNDKFTTPVFVGIREGYLSNQDDIRKLEEINGIKITHGTPISMANKFAEILE